jgi:gamma-glutamyl-gamma-aminobutyrate hydrolase PuuD
LAPGYEERHFEASQKRGKLALIASGDGRDDSVKVHQDMALYAGHFDGAEAATLPIADGRRAYVHVVRGKVAVNGKPLSGGDADHTPERHDPARDATTLPLLRAALARGMPLLAICRGIQELNVALGGSLHQQLQSVAGRMDHRAGPGAPEAQYAPRHAIALSGSLAALLGAREIMVNSLHEQGIDRVADGLSAEALAPDGTVEAVRVTGAASFAYGVQWHPEWQAAANPQSRTLFAAFAAACRRYAESR